MQEKQQKSSGMKHQMCEDLTHKTPRTKEVYDTFHPKDFHAKCWEIFTNKDYQVYDSGDRLPFQN